MYMNSAWVRWPVGIVFGILSGYFSFGIIAPFVVPVFGSHPELASKMPGGYEGMMLTAVVVEIVMALVVSVLLARMEKTKRLIGWGCMIFGTILLLNVISVGISAGFQVQDLAQADARTRNDHATAAWFWVIALAMPFISGCLLLYVVGFLLLRRGRKTEASA
ncbi:hypothetical protein [Nitratireductor pacificus]|uniref:Uncharacterized protein n=1 Tax=Nitratireductor pacificus pht-3B TaxID=391937 RepID=K2MIE3_9HYPH|nr:hypothetical protein [Nitratireductor pacificus]EKF20480.1 hypothetical protein NA2_01809 [Nitratireductor pacificus pht-3B]